MNFTSQIIINVFTSSIVSAFVIFVFRTYISEKIKSSIKSEYDRKLEDFKSKIKQLEFLRDSRYEALRDLISIYYKIYPELRFPDMEWEDALSDIADDFKNHKKLLTDFMKSHGHVMDKELTELIEFGILQCEQGIFEDDHNQLKHADKLIKSVIKVKETLSNTLNSGVAEM